MDGSLTHSQRIDRKSSMDISDPQSLDHKEERQYIHRPSRSASIADILNDGEAPRPSSSRASMRGISPASRPNSASFQAPHPPFLSSSTTLSDDPWHAKRSPSTLSTPTFAPHYLPPTPTTPLYESPPSRSSELPYYEDPRNPVRTQHMPSFPQHSPALMPDHRPSAINTHSVYPGSSGEWRASQPSPYVSSHRSEPSPSLQHILNADEDRRRASISPTTSDTLRYASFPDTPGGMAPPETPGRLKSSGSIGNLVHVETTGSSDRADESARASVSSPGSTHSSVKHEVVKQSANQQVQDSADVLHRDDGRVNADQHAPQNQTSASKALSSSSQGAPVEKPLPQNPGDSRRPYQPKSRVSVPTTVRLPITFVEADRLNTMCRNPLRAAWQEENSDRSDGWVQVRKELETVQDNATLDRADHAQKTVSSAKRKKPSSSIPEGKEDTNTNANASLVAAHYNSRQNVGLGARKLSPILPLRNFNNWIKSVLIQSYGSRRGRVLDLGGGKGGDLNKWEKAGSSELVLADIAEVSVSQARDRYHERRFRFKADFYAMDCFGTELASVIPMGVLSPMFDNVSLQFCLHYGWENVPKAQMLLENVSRYLRPGGFFLGTIPDCDNLRARLVEAQSRSPPSRSFGNAFYHVDFDETPGVSQGKFPPFGHRYTFTLKDAVEAVAEFVVDWSQLESMASQNGLVCRYKKPFAEVWRDERGIDQFRDLARRVGIPVNRDTPMDTELWEACSE